MNDKPGLDIAEIEARIARNLGRLMFAARWLMAPIYIGLLAVLAMLCRIGLDRRGSKPPPQIVIQY